MQKLRQWWKEHYDNYLLSGLSIATYSKNNNVKKIPFITGLKGSEIKI